jgi:chemotaxis-related protein WspB
MLLLVFQAGKQRFGLDAADVIEVAPALECRAVPHAPAYIAGLANYRGATAPVIDVSALLTGEAAALFLSTRTVMVRYRGNSLGLLVERAVETVACNESDLQPMPVAVEGARYLGPILMDGAGAIQKISVDGLLPEDLRTALFPSEPFPAKEIA